MYLSKRQLEEAIDQSNNSPTKLIRNLLTVFFTPSVLASSSCGGTRKFPCLNRDVIAACIRKFTNCMHFFHLYSPYYLQALCSHNITSIEAYWWMP